MSKKAQLKRMVQQRIIFPIQAKLLPRPFLYEMAKNAYLRVDRMYRFFAGKLQISSGLYVSATKGLVAWNGFGADADQRPVPPYQANYEAEESFDGFSKDVKVIAYHLPQFHATPENDEWWGKGFTEWTNTRKAKPLFPGHYQPREPHDDIGYYDLSDVAVLKRQAKLARRHGIDGFAFYHYWFHGRRLLGKPVDTLLAHPEIDIDFCLCWANETWSKRWDGKDHHILAQQTFSDEDDIRFIEYLAPFFRDRRYIKVNGRPLLQVYRVSKLPSARATANRWRDWCRINGIGEIHLVAVTHSEIQPSDSHLKKIGFDAYAAFTPHNFPCAHIPSEAGLFESGYRFNYADGVARYQASDVKEKSYECCTLGWDNTARFGKKAMIYLNFSMHKYHKWLVEAVRRTRQNFEGDNKLIFINAWNEWAEGAYLEPDKKYGYAALNTTSRAIFGLPMSECQQGVNLSLENSAESKKEPDASSAVSGSQRTHVTETADKYTKDYEWLRFTIESDAENSLTKVNKMIRDGSAILEFGPAAGYFTRYLQQHRGATVDIIEIDEACAKRAAEFARDCLVADLERDDWHSAFEGRAYDHILFADVLEHLRDPLAVLRASSSFLKPGGQIIISVPNIGHWQILASLINNDFSYNNVGIMDRTHLRFFTEATLRQMIFDAGLQPQRIEPVLFPDLPAGCGTQWNKTDVPRKIKRFLRSRAYADAIQIVVCCSKADALACDN